MTCRACGKSWIAGLKPDGTMPKGARCPVRDGGCGTFAVVPKPRVERPRAWRPVLAEGPAVILTWDPPSEPRTARQSGDPCPGCGGGTLASPRGTVRACPACSTRVAPPGVLAPYQRDGAMAARQVRSQRERDLDAIGLARRKGVMLAQLDALAADDRLDPASMPVVEWFRAQVKDAAGDGRLDELAALLPEAGIRRRRWWHRQPAAITAGYADEDDEDDSGEDEGQDYEDQDYEDQDGSGMPAIRAAPARAADYAGAMSALGWQMTRQPGGGCQIDTGRGTCGSPWAEHIATASWAGGFACSRHLAALRQVITSTDAERAAL